MPNIGDRLEEARKRQGISIREAAEATKVRGDFLLNFESNEFDFDLPEVYKRGFLKLYARYLKVDVDKIMTDYHAIMLGSGKPAKRETREHFGRMDLPESIKPLGSPDSQPPFSSPPQSTVGNNVGARTPSMAGDDSEAASFPGDSSLYWKIGIIFVGGFVIVGLIAMLVNAIVSSGGTEVDEVDVPVATGTSSQTGVSSSRGLVKIIASGDVGSLLIRQEQDKELLFKGPLRAGEEIVVEREGPVRILSSDVDKFAVELNGKRFTSPAQGIGQMRFSMTGPE